MGEEKQASSADQKSEQAIAALISHRSVEEAARVVGVNANTLLRWMKEPEFEAAYREARRMVFSHNIERLQDAAGAAVNTVLKIMVDPNSPAPTRLRAAEVVLEKAAKACEMVDLEDRVAKFDRLLQRRKSPDSSRGSAGETRATAYFAPVAL